MNSASESCSFTRLPLELLGHCGLNLFMEESFVESVLVLIPSAMISLAVLLDIQSIVI